MTRKAKLYYLNNTDYSPIKEIIEFDSDAVFLSDRIAVYNHTTNSSDNYYILISIDDKIDKIIEENGGTEASTNDLYKARIKDGKHQGNFIFGDEQLTDLLS
jgi:hypothetical protein